LPIVIGDIGAQPVIDPAQLGLATMPQVQVSSESERGDDDSNSEEYHGGDGGNLGQVSPPIQSDGGRPSLFRMEQLLEVFLPGRLLEPSHRLLYQIIGTGFQPDRL
jgi:hypothetical protein